MNYNIRFLFADNTRYEVIKHSSEGILRTGRWMEPFPNTKKDSQAFGMVENFSVYDLGEAMIEEHGDVVEVEVVESGNELDQLRRENRSLRWHVRSLSAKSDKCSMMAVDFPAFEKRVKATTEKVVPTDNLLALIHDQWDALVEAKDAYQCYDNSYNFFKNELSIALEGSPEMSEDEEDLVNNTWVGMVEKLMEAWKQSKADLNKAVALMEALYSQQAMPDDSLNPEVDAFLAAHPYVEPTND